jgi:hypothetical protein
MSETPDLAALIAKADHIFLSLEAPPSKLPRLIQTRAQCKRYLAERPGRA